MKKLIALSLWGFAAWVLAGLVIPRFLFGQNSNDKMIAGANIQSAAIQIQTDIVVTDQQLADEINVKIHDFVFYGVYDYITADVTDGIVILNGWAHEAWIADVLAKKLSHVDGVKKIDNRIQQTTGPEDLARRAVRAIYSDALFEKYSFRSDPPIHVVVNNNTIILAGTAANNAERDRATNLVDFKTNVLTVYNQLEVNK